MMAFSGETAATKFDTKDGDALYRWAKRRAEYFAVANVSAARSVSQSGSSFASSGWVYNPYYSMFTYVPLSGMFYSPFGYAFWSPFTVYRAYYYGPSVFSRGGSTIPVTSTTPGQVSRGYHDRPEQKHGVPANGRIAERGFGSRRAQYRFDPRRSVATASGSGLEVPETRWPKRAQASDLLRAAE